MKFIHLKILAFLLTFAFISCNPKGKVKNLDTQSSEDKVNETKIEDSEIDFEKWKKTAVSQLKVTGYSPQFTEDEEAIIFTSGSMNGLWFYDLKKDEQRQLCDKKGAGFKPVVTDGSIVYQVREKRKYIESVGIESGEMQKIDVPTSSLSPETYVNNLKLQENKMAIIASLSDDLSEIIIRKNGKDSRIAPQGNKNYLDVEISPDQKMILYDCPGYGGFVVDLKGNILNKLGSINTPSWIDNKNVLYAKSKDDGHQVLESQVYVYNLSSGNEVNVSNDLKLILENPRVNGQKNKIIAHTPEGEIFLIQGMK